MIHGKNGPALWLTRALLGLLALGLLAGGALFVIPNGYERAGWRLQVWWTQIRQSVLAAPEVLPTPQSVAHNATPLILPTLTPTLSPTAAPEASPVPPTPTRPPLPAQFELSGFTGIQNIQTPIGSVKTLYPSVGDMLGNAMLLGLVGLLIGLWVTRKK